MCVCVCVLVSERDASFIAALRKCEPCKKELEGPCAEAFVKHQKVRVVCACVRVCVCVCLCVCVCAQCFWDVNHGGGNPMDCEEDTEAWRRCVRDHKEESQKTGVLLCVCVCIAYVCVCSSYDRRGNKS